MSDYPRPVPPSPPKPYGLDRLFAGAIGVLAVGSLGQGVLYVFRHPPPASGLPATVYLGVYAVSFALYGWILWGLVRSRFWAFVTALVLSLMTLAGHTLAVRRASGSVGIVTVSTVAESVIVLYAVARLFTLVGPSPIRRQDLYGRS